MFQTIKCPINEISSIVLSFRDQEKIRKEVFFLCEMLQLKQRHTKDALRKVKRKLYIKKSALKQKS